MKRIVIAEDDLFMREELRDILLKERYEISVVENFGNTVGEIEKSNPDLVLLDVNLPGRSGFEICRELKKHMAVPVLILTSRDQLSDELHALDFGADDYLTKPFNPLELVARVAGMREGRICWTETVFCWTVRLIPCM